MVCQTCGIALQTAREFQLPSGFELCTEMATPEPTLADVYSDLLPPRPNDDIGHNDSSWVSANERRRLAMVQGGVLGYIKEAELQLGRDVQDKPHPKLSHAEFGVAPPNRTVYRWK